jgi:hypothetical protein
MYEFAYRTPVAGGLLRATHALEIPFVWDNLDAEGAGLFVGAVDDGLRSLSTSLADAWVAFARDGAAARAGAQRLARSARDLHRQIDEADSFAHWNDADMERLFEGAVGTLVGEVVGNVVGQALSVGLSGDARAVAELEARTEGLDRSIEALVEKRSRDLERRASGLCPRLQQLARLGTQLQVRLDDGSRLQLVRVDD